MRKQLKKQNLYLITVRFLSVIMTSVFCKHKSSFLVIMREGECYHLGERGVLAQLFDNMEQ